MAANKGRLLTAFIGGGSLVLGFGLSYNGLGNQITKRKFLFGKTLCETYSQENKLLEKVV